jgi:hypothetical protein
VIARPLDGIVERNVDQGSEKGVAYFARSAGESGDGMVGGWARHELAVADGQGRQHLKPLIVFGQVADHIDEQFEGVDVLGQERGGGWRGLVAAQHRRVDKEVRKERVTFRGRHGQPDSSRWPWTKDTAAAPCYVGAQRHNTTSGPTTSVKWNA